MASGCRRPNGWYDEAILKRASDGPMTAKEIGAIMKTHGTDAVIWLRKRRDLSVTVVGELIGKGNNKVNLYRVERCATNSIEPEGVHE